MSLKPLFALFILLVVSGCETSAETSEEAADAPIGDLPAAAAERLDHLLAYPIDAAAFPRSVEPDGSVKSEAVRGWTSGFIPGTLWLAYELSGDLRYRERAEAWTEQMEPQTVSTRSHDVGFQINCSYGEGYKVNNDPAYRQAIITTAETLTKRYNDTVGAIKSWDWGDWRYPVIVDNMMNLELLYEASELSGDTTFAYVANRHAMTTLRNHYREDNSSVHVVEYDKETGEVLARKTHQGNSDDSAWARGQAWGLYGFTMAHARSGKPEFLEQARKIADFFMNHPNMPEDGVPYWDFDAPGIPDAPRDASAAAIAASALYQLAALVDDGDTYRSAADRIVASLNSEDYYLPADSDLPFILTHSTGHKPQGSEVDVPLNYADYYFLEALVRQRDMG